MIETLTNSHLEHVVSIFNHAAKICEFPYKCLKFEQAHEIFLRKYSKSFVYHENESIVGFITGYYDEARQTFFITFIYVLPTHRRQNIGSSLLTHLENEVLQLEQVKQIEMSYHNRHNLIWVIENTPQHLHPNAPGVELGSAAYYFYQNHSYVQTSQQNNYYRLLENFEGSGISDEALCKLEDAHIEMAYYDEKNHVQLNELFDDFDHLSWRDIIMGNVNSTLPLPVLILAQDHVVKGFTGPLYVQEDGRGFFSGIGVHSSIRGYKAGKYLFYGLCHSLKEQGATYMSLFTREDNYARYIYEGAGFKLVKSWACFEKQLKR